MEKKEITVYPTGTVANMVCGFDVLGFALNEPADKMVMRLLNERTVRIVHHDAYNLPTEAAKNVAGVALLDMLADMPGENIGFEVEITKIIKPGSGIGSSAASAAGAVWGANMLLDERFSKAQLIQYAMAGEELASGSRHADNIAPCIYGGVTLVRSHDPLDIICLDAPELYVTVLHPQIEVKTSDAREILKKQLLLKDAIHQWGNIAGLVAGLLQKDYDLISRSLEDVIVEPVRSILIPMFDELKRASKEAGALGGGISGSGPSVFMLSADLRTAQIVSEAMNHVYVHTGIEFHTYVTTLNKPGIKTAWS